MYFVKNRKIERVIFLFLFSLFLMLFLISTIHADWYVYKRAEIKSKQGPYLRFESLNGEYIKFWFRLPSEDEGAFLNEPPIYKVDGNEIHVIKKGEDYKGLKIRAGHYITWIISNGDTPSKELNEFVNGQEAVFQYYRDDGEIMEAVFLLDGIKEAMGKILN